MSVVLCVNLNKLGTSAKREVSEDDFRDLLDSPIMEDWEKHNIERLKLFPGKRASIYSFAYWLVRWSGLVRPNNIDHRDKK